MVSPKQSQRPFVSALPVTLLVLICLVFVACATKTPEEKVDASRAAYEARLSTFQIREVPIESAMPMVDEAAEAAEEVDDTAGGEMAMDEAPPVEVRQDLILDLLLVNNSGFDIEGLTLDVTQADSAGAEKARYRVYVLTGDVVRGQTGQKDAVIEGIDYVEGDGFAIEIRQGISAGERAEYREYAAAAAAGS